MRVFRHSSGGQDGRRRPPSPQTRIHRFVSPFIIVAALAVGYLLLTQLVPRLQQNLLEVPEDVSVHWSAPIWSAADAVNQSRRVAVGAIALAAALSLLLSIISRPTALLVYLVSICLCVLDLAILVGALTHFYAQLIDSGL